MSHCKKILIICPEFFDKSHKGYQNVLNNIIKFQNNYLIDVISVNLFTHSSLPHNKFNSFFSYKIGLIGIIYNILLGLFSFTPLQISIYKSSKLKSTINKKIKESNYDWIYFNTIRVDFYSNIKLQNFQIMGLIDDPSDSYFNISKNSSIFFKIVFYYEAILLYLYKNKMIEKYNLIGYVSNNEVSKFSNSKNILLPYGVDNIPTAPFNNIEKSKNTIIFTGNLGYINNQSGIIYFIKNIFPLVLEQAPNTLLLIVGARPSRKLISIAEVTPNVKLHSNVPDIFLYLKNSTIAIAPIFSKSGIQTKILDAMSLGLPVVTTLAGNAGIGAKNEFEIFVANDPIRFSNNIISLLKDEKLRIEISKNALNFLRCNYDLEKNSATFFKTINNITK